MLDPNDLETQRALAKAYDAAGKTAVAAELRESTVQLRAMGLRVRATRLADEAEAARPAVFADEDLRVLADNEVRELLSQFPLLQEGELRSVALAPIAVKEPFYRPRHAVPDRLEKALRIALTEQLQSRAPRSRGWHDGCRAVGAPETCGFGGRSPGGGPAHLPHRGRWQQGTGQAGSVRRGQRRGDRGIVDHQPRAVRAG